MSNTLKISEYTMNQIIYAIWKILVYLFASENIFSVLVAMFAHIRIISALMTSQHTE